MTSTQDIGPAGIATKPYRPRCQFGGGHIWIAAPTGDDRYSEDVYQCSRCGAVSSNFDRAKQFRASQRFFGYAVADSCGAIMAYDRSKADPYDQAWGLDRDDSDLYRWDDDGGGVEVMA